MALPERPVVAVVGDGSSTDGIQALWSAAHYRAGVLFVILSNGGYAIMDRLAERVEREPPWPSFDVDVAALARAFGCAARRISTDEELGAELDEDRADAQVTRRAGAARCRDRSDTRVRAVVRRTGARARGSGCPLPAASSFRSSAGAAGIRRSMTGRSVEGFSFRRATTSAP